MIIASGETEVDAVTASGLAGNLNAPVLLTRSSRLPHNVARFIDEHNVTDVVIVGGTASVPDSIVTSIESLGSRPSVERISGDDRYATAAAIGDRLGGPNPTWCGSSQTAAILVNGGADGRADAVISGPLAFRLGLPILLTAADELPESTASFLTDNKVERVVIVGGTGAVSAGVVNELVEEVGVVNVQRISGGSAAATSVMIAKEMLGNCAAVLATDADMVALVNRDATADGIAAAPVLGRGLGDGGSVPILLVGDELPAAVSGYLASTAEMRAGNKTHLDIVAIGGTAVVSDSVMADAVAAAKTSSALTAEINVKVNPVTKKYETHDAGTAGDATDDGGVFTVTFSDEVMEASVTDPTLYRVNGRRIEALVDTESGNEESITAIELVVITDRTVRVRLSHVLEPGDTISVVGGGKVGDHGDRRKLEAASLTLGALPSSADRTAPVVEIVAVAGLSEFTVFVTEPNPLHNEMTGSEFDNFVKIKKKSAAADATLTAPSGPADATAVRRQGVTQQWTVTTTDALAVGDVITVERKTFLDKGGRGNALRRHTIVAPKAQGKFEISSVAIGDHVHEAQAAATITSADATPEPKLKITAKKGGPSDGAAGNGWVIYGYDDRAGGATSQLAFDIDVGVDTANQVISYTISDVVPNRSIGRVATMLDLATALNGNDDFAANFGISFADGVDSSADDGTNDDSNDPIGATDPAGEPFTGGMTAVGVLVTFNDAVWRLSAAGGAASESTDGGVALAASIAPDGGATGVVNFLRPDHLVHITYRSASMAALPKRAGFRVIPAGIAVNHDGTGDTAGVNNVREILNSLRPNSSIKPVPAA